MIDETTVFTITVKWDPVDCMHQNGLITEYIIQYYYKQDRKNETMVYTTSMLEYTITDLQPLTVYVIEVAAVNDAGIGIYGNITAETKSCKLQSFSLLIQKESSFKQTLFTTAYGDGDTSANSDTSASCSATIAVSAVSLLLNITLATVILIQCLFVLRRKKPKDMLHSTNDETYAEPIKQVDVSTAPNEAYGLHKITKPSEEDTTYEMVK